MSYFNPFSIDLDKRVTILLFLSFSSGLPILLIFSKLSLWLKSAGIDRSTITLFSWAELASTAFVAFLVSLTNTKFTATQFVFFTSIMVIIPKLLSGNSGTLVDNFGYHDFFIITAIIGISAIILIKISIKNG